MRVFEAGRRRRTPLVTLIAANAISRAGNVVTAIAVPWYVLDTTGSPAKTGLAGFAGAVPVVISLLFGGTLVDRFSYRRVSVVGDLASGLSVAMIPLLAATVGLPFWTLLVFVFWGALLDIPGSLARMAMLPDIAAQAGMRIERAYSLDETPPLIASLVGPAVTGVLIATLGARQVLWIDAASFGVSALLVAVAVPEVVHAAKASPDRHPGYRAQFIDGLRFIRADRLLFSLVLVFAAMNIVVGPIDSVFLPVYADEVFGSAVRFGLMAAASGAGALGGTLLFGAIGHRMSRRLVFLGGYLAVPLVLLALSTTPGIIVTLGVLVLLGLALGTIDPLEYTIYFERIPEQMRARVLGITGALGWCTVPIGRIGGGLLLDRFGLTTTLALLGGIFALVPLALLTRPIFRDLAPPTERRAADASIGEQASAST